MGKSNTYFLGWTNIKWFIREVGRIYSDENSYFSKKRIESGFAFIVGQAGMIMFLINKYSALSMTDFLLWAGMEFSVAGYLTYQIQKQRRNDMLESYSEDPSIPKEEKIVANPNCPTCGKPMIPTQDPESPPPGDMVA